MRSIRVFMVFVFVMMLVFVVKPAYAATGDGLLTIWDINGSPSLVCAGSTGDPVCSNVQLIKTHKYRFVLREINGYNFKYGKISLSGFSSPAWTFNLGTFVGSGGTGCSSQSTNPVYWTCTGTTDWMSQLILEATPTDNSYSDSSTFVEIQKSGQSLKTVPLGYNPANPTFEIRKCSDNSIVSPSGYTYILAKSTCYKFKIIPEATDPSDYTDFRLTTSGNYPWGWSSASYSFDGGTDVSCHIEINVLLECAGTPGYRSVFSMTFQATSPSTNANSIASAHIGFLESPSWYSLASLIWYVQ